MSGPISGISLGRNLPCEFPNCKPMPETAWVEKQDTFDANREFERRAKERAGHSSWAKVVPSQQGDPTRMANRLTDQNGIQIGGHRVSAHPLLKDNPAYDGADPRLRVTPNENPDGIENYQQEEQLRLQHVLQPGFSPAPNLLRR